MRVKQCFAVNIRGKRLASRAFFIADFVRISPIMASTDNNIFELAYECLLQKDPGKKISLVNALYQRLNNDELDLSSKTPVLQITIPGRPDKPELVNPSDVPRRGFNSKIARVRLVHAIAHIEFNAINLALDVVYRFQDMPRQFYIDWMQVAAEEAKHFSLLERYLKNSESYYGAYAAHNGLWEMALKTHHDVMIRLALVPRVLEARGLDVTPGMINRLKKADDIDLVSILEIIHKEEIGHVRIGSIWFSYVCKQRDLDSESTFSDILDEYMTNASFGPFDFPSREKAGFTKQEMQNLVARTNHN